MLTAEGSAENRVILAGKVTLIAEGNTGYWLQRVTLSERTQWPDAATIRAACLCILAIRPHHTFDWFH